MRPPLAEVRAREVLLLSGAMNFVQCPLDGATWTLLVDIVEYDSGRCEPEPDTVISLLRNETLVLSRVVVSVITSYSIHYTKLYETASASPSARCRARHCRPWRAMRLSRLWCA